MGRKNIQNNTKT